MVMLDRAKVLVIDDNRQIRQIVHAVLQGCVGEVREAEEPYAALQAWTAWAPDLVLVDFQMPRMDGITFTRVVRDFERVRGRHTAIVMMTGHGEISVVRSARQAGVDGFISKPLCVGSLLHRLQRALVQGTRRRREAA